MGKNTLEPCEAREHDGTKLTDEENDRVENRSYWDNKLDYRNRSHHHSMESHRIRQIIHRSYNSLIICHLALIIFFEDLIALQGNIRQK